MKTIIVPTDFSAISNNAIDYAVDLAKATGSSILVFHAYQVPVSMTDVPIVLLSVEDLQRNNESKMDDLKKSLQESTGDSIKIYTETKLGDTVDEGMNTIQLAGTDWNDAVKAYNTRRAQIKGEIVARVSAYFGFDLPVTFPYYQGANVGQPVQNPLATQPAPPTQQP